MICVETIKTIPQNVVDDLVPFGKEEWNAAGVEGEAIIKLSERIHLISDNEMKPLMVVGLIRPTMCSAPETYAFVTNNMLAQPQYLRRLKRIFFLLLGRSPIITTKIEVENKISQRFAEFFGFSLVKLNSKFAYYEVINDAIPSNDR